MRRQETPPPQAMEMADFWKGQPRAAQGGKPMMAPSWHLHDGPSPPPPGAHCAGSRAEMSCPITGHLLTIAPQGSEPTDSAATNCVV